MPHNDPGVSWKWLAIAGGALGLSVLAFGFAAERIRFGADASDTARLLTQEVERALRTQANSLTAVAGRLRAQPSLTSALSEGTAGSQRLFALLEGDQLPRRRPDQAITLYDAANQPLAWVGRPSTLPAVRLSGPAALFVAPGPLGLRLVYIEPISGNGQDRRAGAVAAEQVLLPAVGIGLSEELDYTWPTSLVPVVLVPRYARSASNDSLQDVVLRDQTGSALLEIRVDDKAVAAARAQHRASTFASVSLVLIATLVLLGSPIDRWRRGRSGARYVLGSLALCACLLAARGILWFSLPHSWRLPRPFPLDRPSDLWSALLLRSPVDLLAHGAFALVVVGVVASAVDRLRCWRRQRDRAQRGREDSRLTIRLLAHSGAGVVAAFFVVAFSTTVSRVVEQADVDILHLSLHPYEFPRLALIVGLITVHGAAIVAAALAMLVAEACLRPTKSPVRGWVLPVVCWLTPALLAAGLLSGGPLTVPTGPSLVTVVAAMCLALAWRRAATRLRHSSEAGRVVVAILAFVVPAVLLYPALAAAAGATKQRLIAERFAVETLALPRTLLSRLDEARRQIDRIADLDSLIPAVTAGPTTSSEVAFSLWRRTALATWRLTSAVEMYDAEGRLVNRFALNLPEYDPRAQQYQVATCRWGVFGEATPFGAEDRRMLHAERGICDASGRVVGGVVLHVLLDYATLSFISSQSPYFQVLSGRAVPTAEEISGHDVELTIYGWGRTAIFTTSGSAWRIDERLFGQIYRSNQGFWTILEAGGRRSVVYLVSDRNGIYALGYPASTWFDAGVRLAELATLGAVVACLVLVGSSLLQRLARRGHWTGRLLIDELRSSFSRKLFLSFVAATVIPVLILAFAIRALVASRLRDDVEAEASRTAAVAQRVIEETLSLERRAEVAPSALDDDALVWISRIIGQDVNVYEGAELVATSERDLFASGQLTTRTPDAVYEALLIDRRPTFIGEDELAGLPYLMAAAPVRSGAGAALLTVPFTLRQREIEREIDELDRSVQLGALVFILLGSAVGYWLADRISDPVQRLTRASRRIAAGDLDTRVFVRSADELRRLVEAFNKMAWELQRQRTQLERTNRLEAWAEMARQVAHDIKNPLTPIQLSAEHLRRVHRDRGEPLSPVLDGCIDTILAQVRLLRQIAGEFSSFATTPVPHPMPTEVLGLVEEIVGAYVTGLEGRVVFEVDVSNDVPPVHVDRALVGRAITNIVENALHAMPSGGTISIRVRPDPSGVLMTVSDTGVGMDDEALGRIFEPYFSTKASGTGLGLTIAKRNVEIHGGTISIASQRGAGTRVSIRLPSIVRSRHVPAGPAAPAP